MTKQTLNDLSYLIIGCAIEVHRRLGPGLLESVYHKCMAEEMNYKGIPYISEFAVPVIYRNIKNDTDL